MSVPRQVDSLDDLEERLALLRKFSEPLQLVKYVSVRELLTAWLYYIREQGNGAALESVAANTCCGSCQEAAFVARAAIKAAKGAV